MKCKCPIGDIKGYFTGFLSQDCPSKIGQIQEVIFLDKKDYNAEELKEALKSAPKFSVENPTSEAGEAITFGGGNQTKNGIEKIIGRKSTKFTATLYSVPQSVVAEIKAYECFTKNVAVVFKDEYNRYVMQKEDAYRGFEMNNFFLSDLKIGGLENPDENTLEIGLKPEWSKGIVSLELKEIV